MNQSFGADYNKNCDNSYITIYWIVGIVIISRLMVLLWFKPGSMLGNYTDYQIYYSIAKLSDFNLLPFIHFWREYPPLNLYLILPIYKLAVVIQPYCAKYGLHDFAVFTVFLYSFMAAIETAVIIFLYKIAARIYNINSAISAVLIYSLLFYPLYVLYFSFDYIYVFLVLLAVWLFIEQKYNAALIVAGIGAASKIIPIFLIFAFVRHRRKLIDKLLAIFIPILILILSFLPFIYAAPEFVKSFFAFLIKRPAWETPAALLNGYYSVGKALPPNQYLNSESYKILIDSTPDKYSIFFVITGGLLLILFAIRQSSKTCDYEFVKSVLSVLAIVFLFSKGWSSQYILILLPLIILVYRLKTAIILILLLSVFNYIECPIYINYFPDKPVLLIIAIAGRMLVLLYILIGKYFQNLKCFEMPPDFLS